MTPLDDECTPPRMSSERRRHPRLRFDLPLRVDAGHSLISARAADISEGGVFIRTKAAIAEGARVRMRLHLDDVVLVCDGIVRWRLRDGEGRRHGVGVEFERLSPTALATIRRFMRKHGHELSGALGRVVTPPRPRPHEEHIDFDAALR